MQNIIIDDGELSCIELDFRFGRRVFLTMLDSSGKVRAVWIECLRRWITLVVITSEEESM